MNSRTGNWFSWICLSPFTKYVLPSFVIALAILISIYFGMLIWWSPQDNSESQSTCHLQVSYYVPCLPGKSMTLNNCLEMGCCWRDDLNMCYHAFPSPYGYKLNNFNGEGNVVLLIVIYSLILSILILTMPEKSILEIVGLKEFLSFECYCRHELFLSAKIWRRYFIPGGTITALRKFSPTGKAIRENLGFHISQNNDRIRISLKTNSRVDNKSNGPVSNQPLTRKTIASKKSMDFDNISYSSPSNDQVQISRLYVGMIIMFFMWFSFSSVSE